MTSPSHLTRLSIGLFFHLLFTAILICAVLAGPQPLHHDQGIKSTTSDSSAQHGLVPRLGILRVSRRTLLATEGDDTNSDHHDALHGSDVKLDDSVDVGHGRESTDSLVRLVHGQADTLGDHESSNLQIGGDDEDAAHDGTDSLDVHSLNLHDDEHLWDEGNPDGLDDAVSGGAGEEGKQGGDDKTVPVDDESMKKLLSERDNLAKKLSEMDTLRKRMAHKHELLRRVLDLKTRLEQSGDEEKRLREEESRMEESVKSAVMKRNANADERDSIARERHKVEKLLEELQSEKESSEIEYEKVTKERAYVDAQEKDLLEQKDKLEASVKELVEQFQQDGFHTWLKSNLDTLPPIFRETILKTSVALDPVIQGVEGASELNERLTSETTEAITRYLPMIRESPFYTGLIFYIILLFPTVAAFWLVARVRARLSLLTIEHYLITINLYFGAMSTVCTIMTLVSGTDILVVFRHRSRHIAESFMLFHGLLFIIHLVLHGMTAYVSGSRKDFAQYICISCVGLHFFLHAYKRAILDLDPNVGTTAYVIYAFIFWYMLYDRGVHIFQALASGRRTGVSAFGTFPNEDDLKADTPFSEPRDPRRDTTVYFAGLPVFNGPSKSALSDAKTI